MEYESKIKMQQSPGSYGFCLKQILDWTCWIYLFLTDIFLELTSDVCIYIYTHVCGHVYVYMYIHKYVYIYVSIHVHMFENYFSDPVKLFALIPIFLHVRVSLKTLDSKMRNYFLF